jgi:F0F1-type ATP synthase membrane subunit c/vacuolar-type H+-ATPase subunit K
MNYAFRILLGLALVLAAAQSTPAQEKSDKEQKQAVEIAKANSAAPSGAGVGMGLSIVGVGIGLGLIGWSALASIARQPEQAGKVQGVMYVLAALVEGAGIIAVLLCFLVAARIMG